MVETLETLEPMAMVTVLSLTITSLAPTETAAPTPEAMDRIPTELTMESTTMELTTETAME
jgi:hypothetical protein